MTDRLTQLQDCLDDLATQMFASLRYIQTHHSYAAIEGQPDQNPNPLAETAIATSGAGHTVNGSTTDIPTQPQEDTADSPEVFQASLRELARDLILKEQQIEYLIGVLPGIGTSEADQNARITALETRLRQTEEERKAAMLEKNKMLDILGQLASNSKRVH